MTRIAARASVAATAAMAAASLWFAPWRGTPVALAGDVAFAALLLASLALLAGWPRALRREGASWGLAVAGAAVQCSVPVLGWSPTPPALSVLVLGPGMVVALAFLVGLAGAIAHRIARASPRPGLVLLAVAGVALVGASALERTRVRQLRQGATNASVNALRDIEFAQHHPERPGPSLDGWGWPIRVEGSGERLRIISPGARGRFESVTGRGPVASWEDDLVVGAGSAWERWPPTGNAPNVGTPEPWRDWRTPRWR